MLAVDGVRDVIDVGTGRRDEAVFDRRRDSVRKTERLHPMSVTRSP